LAREFRRRPPRTGVTRSPRRADSALGCAKSKRRGPIRHCVSVGV
jgi:hypothetical protein